MQAIYEAHFVGLAEDTESPRQLAASRPIEAGETALAGFSRSAFTELDTLFPRLPNPTLVLYVFPHLAGPEGLPVPGYATTFTLYERAHYSEVYAGVDVVYYGKYAGTEIKVDGEDRLVMREDEVFGVVEQ